MSKTTRFFEVIQCLRNADKPVLARDLAVALEVSVRTIYRDIASLQAMQTPIVGEPGIGYVMRRGYDLPPVNFDKDEAEAVAVGLTMIARTGDPGLWRAARRASHKLHELAPGTRKLIASSWGVQDVPALDLTELRRAIRHEQKMKITYGDVESHKTTRVIWPLVLIYYVDNVLVVAWCELRQSVRHFRLDRVSKCAFLADSFKGQGDAIVTDWERTQKHDTVSTKSFDLGEP